MGKIKNYSAIGRAEQKFGLRNKFRRSWTELGMPAELAVFSAMMGSRESDQWRVKPGKKNAAGAEGYAQTIQPVKKAYMDKFGWDTNKPGDAAKIMNHHLLSKGKVLLKNLTPTQKKNMTFGQFMYLTSKAYNGGDVFVRQPTIKKVLSKRGSTEGISKRTGKWSHESRVYSIIMNSAFTDLSPSQLFGANSKGELYQRNIKNRKQVKDALEYSRNTAAALSKAGFDVDAMKALYNKKVSEWPDFWQKIEQVDAI